jgi:hypothetical protein
MDDAALKIVYLAVESASQRCTMPIRDWKSALNRFMIEFNEKLTQLFLHSLNVIDVSYFTLMNYRRISIILLLWLFSLQLFSVVWAMPLADRYCVKYTQNICVNKLTESTEHTMPMPTVTDSDFSSHHNQTSVICDLCFIACQPLIFSTDIMSFIKIVDTAFSTQSISPPIDAFMRIVYRPPILA